MVFYLLIYLLMSRRLIMTAQDPKTPKRSMWDYLKRYKNDHVQSSLPKEVN
jgi:hypothetical protein